MAHQDQKDFALRVRNRFANLFRGARVLDCGSLDVNGNNRYLFEGGNYVGLDVVPGKNVDIVGTAHQHSEPDGTYDVVVSTEMLEHDPHWAASLCNMARLVKPGGVLLITCATTGRAEHFFGPEEWGQYYRNLTEADFRSALNIETLFDESGFEVNLRHADIYFWGLRHDPARPKRQKRRTGLRIAHVVNYAPNLSGMYGSVRELFIAEQKLGLDVGIVDDADARKIFGSYGIDGIYPKPLQFCDEADIICWHHASSDDWFNEPHRNVVMFMHGTPEFNLMTELRNNDPVLSLTVGAAANKACRAFVTMWQRHVPIWESLLRTKVDYIPCWVDLDEFRVSDRETDPKTIQIAMVDYWRLTREPFGLIMAIDWLKKHSGKKVKVDVWGLPEHPNKTWQAVLQWLVEDDTVTLKGVSQNPSADIYHKVDMILTMSTEETRVVREAYACGVPVVCGHSGLDFTQYCADSVRPDLLGEAMLRCHNELVNNTTEIRRHRRHFAEKAFNPTRAAQAAKALFERIVAENGSVNRVRHQINGRRMVQPVLDTANLIRSRMLEHKPVVYVRFGDGKILLMDGHEGWGPEAACPQRNSPELQAELKECFAGSWPGFIVGCTAGQENEGRMRRGVFARTEDDQILRDAVAKVKPAATYHNALSLAYQSVFQTGWFIDFLNRCIRPRKVAMVCSEAVATSELVRRVFNVSHFIIIPSANAYSVVDGITAEVLKAAEQYDVILSAAGPVSAALALRLCKNGFTAKGKTFLDIGSLADALAGLPSRCWIRQVGDDYRNGYATTYAGESAVDIIVLTHGQPEATKRCFASIQAHTPGRYRVIWVDNGSRPEDVAAVKEVADKFETCELLPNAENLGFSKAVNLGLQRSLATGKARHVLLLNNDIVVTPGWLERLLTAMEASGFAAIGPLTSENNPHSLDALRPLVAELPTFNGEPPEIRAERLWGRFGQQVLQSTNMVSFFCCLLSKAVIREVGSLDENLFCYGEDNDYCKRLARKGHKLGIALGAYVHHDHHVTSDSMGDGWVKEQQAKAVHYLETKWKGVPVETPVGPFWSGL